AAQPGEDVVVGPHRVVVVQLAQGAQEGFLHNLLAEVGIAADAVQAESVEGLQGGLGQGLDGVGAARQGPRPPSGIEVRSQVRTSFRRPLFCPPSYVRTAVQSFAPSLPSLIAAASWSIQNITYQHRRGAEMSDDLPREDVVAVVDNLV